MAITMKKEGRGEERPEWRRGRAGRKLGYNQKIIQRQRDKSNKQDPENLDLTFHFSDFCSALQKTCFLSKLNYSTSWNLIPFILFSFGLWFGLNWIFVAQVMAQSSCAVQNSAPAPYLRLQDPIRPSRHPIQFLSSSSKL